MPGKPYMNKHTPSERKQKREAKKLEKQKEQKTTKPFMKKDDAYMMKPYQHNHANMMKGQTMAPSPDMMKPYQANHPNMMKPPMMSQISKHMSHNK